MIFNTAQFSLYQRTPLHIAAREGYLNTVKTLVEKAPDINTTDNDGVSKTMLLRVDPYQ